MTDIGISCAKESYGRTAGTPLTCKPDEEYDAGLCYTPCEHDANGVGPVCWGHCPAGTTNCGGALCLSPDKTCSEYIAGDFKDVFKAVIDIASACAKPTGCVIDIAEIATDYTFPECEEWNNMTTAVEFF